MADVSNLGRPRLFDLADAARDAIKVFSERGYEGASLPDLIEGTGLSRGSLYKAFGDKKGLLLAALDLYMAEGLQATTDILSRPGSVKEAIRQSLLRQARLSTGAAGRLGCLVVGMTTEIGARDEEISKRTSRMFQRMQQLYAAAIAGGQAAGELAKCDEHALARFLVCQIEGMRVLGKAGAREAEMVALVETSMRIFG